MAFMNLKKWFDDHIRDTFDANTARDQQKRISAGQPRFYQQQQKQLGNPSNFEKAGTAIGLGAVRSGVGTGQALSGLYDLVTPGTGTNRFSKKLDNFARFTDQTAKNEGVNNPIYHGAQGVTDALQFLTGAGEAKVAGKFLSEAPKLARPIKIASQAIKPVDRAIIRTSNNLASKGFKGQVAGAALKAGTRPHNLAANVAMTNLYTGQQASKGEDISPGDYAKNLALGSAMDFGLPAAGAVAKRSPQAARTVKYVADKTDPNVRALDEQYTQLNQRWQTASGPLRRQLEKAIKVNRQARANLTRVQLGNSIAQMNGPGLKEATAQMKQFAGSNGNIKPPKTKTAVAPPGGDLPPEQIATAPKGKRRGFINTVKNSQMVTDATKQATDARYKARNTRNLQSEAEKFAKGSLKKNTTLIRSRLDAKTGTISDADVANAIQIAKLNDAKGNTQEASDIYERLSEHLTNQGQTIQAASLLENRTPEGLKFQAERTLKKAGVQITPDLRKQLDAAHAEVRKTQPGTAERSMAAKKYAKVVTDNLPRSFADKATSFWKAGLLTGLRTQTGNALSNTTFGVLHGASNPLAAGIDSLIGLGTGQRTKTLTGRGTISGLGEGLQKGAQVLKTGIDERAALNNKFDMNGEIKFGDGTLGKAATTYVNGVFRLMGAADRPAYYAQLRNSLFDLAQADGLTKGLKGKELSKHVADFVANPPKTAFQRATNEAEKAVLGNDTFLSNVAGRVRQAADNIDNPVGRNVASGAVNVLMPFTKVPSAFISRVFDFTPVGAMKEVVSQIGKRQFDQRELSTALSEATTGTAIMYIGAELANNGLLSGDYPDDPKEQARWKAEGIQPNSVRIGGNWVSLNYLGPVGALFSQGKRAHDTIAQGGSSTDAALGFTGGAVQDALGQSFLQGVSGALDAVNDPKRYASGFTRNQAGSVVPTLVKDIGEAGDPFQRDANNPLQAIQSRIPVARQGLRIKQDVYGNDLNAKTGPASTLTSPLRPSRVRSNDVIAEVNRLHSVDPENKDLQVTPTPLDKAISVDGNKIKLTEEQRYDLQKKIGSETQDAWRKIIVSPEYQQLNDIQKAQALNNARVEVTKYNKEQFAFDNGSTKKQPVKLSNPTVRIKGQDSTYAQKFDFAQQDFNKNSKNWSPVVRAKKQKELSFLSVQKDYDKDTVSLYGMNKGDVFALLNSGPEGKAYADKILAYGDALEKAGLISKNKFRDKYGNVDFDPGRSGGRRKGSKGSKGSGGSKLSSAIKKSTEVATDVPIPEGKLKVSQIKAPAKKLDKPGAQIRVAKKQNVTIKAKKIGKAA